jgi:hypothetical protein
MKRARKEGRGRATPASGEASRSARAGASRGAGGEGGPSGGSRDRTLARLALWTSLAAIAWGSFAAIHQTWLGDDAFISFRYAENLIHGLGLVYNAGERVEGYSNFLWTLWIALGMRLGATPERWSIAWGVFFYAGTIAALALDHLARGRRARSLAALAPLAAWLAAAHPDWQIWATSGLETSLFTFLVTVAYLSAIRVEWGVRGLLGSGLAFALVALTRPDGPLFFGVAAVWVLWARGPRLASLAAFAGAFLVVWAPYVAWKVAYYGDFLPNTYYAKSAAIAWWEQGWIYVSFYFERYWALALAVPLALVAFAKRGSRGDRESGDASARELVLALALALAYIVYVTRVGGDFMYARLLIPATPLLILALTRALEILLARRALVQWAAAAAAVAAVSLTPSPLGDAEIRNGIVDESSIYVHAALAKTKRESLILRRYFEGLPVRIAIVGSQAALAYYARPAVAIECGAGLTDRWIARQPLAKRGRVGHEKTAPISYLLQRQVDFTIHPFSAKTLNLDSELPHSNIAFDDIIGRIVHWDPVVLDEVRRRGARFKDVPSMLDGYIAQVDQLSPEMAREAYVRMKRFYFDHVSDPGRERAFREAVERAEARAS